MKPIMQLQNGLTVHKLTDPESIATETAKMGKIPLWAPHDQHIYSIRDENNTPQIVLSVLFDTLDDCKLAPANYHTDKYIRGAQEFIRTAHIDPSFRSYTLGMIYQDDQYYEIGNLPQNFVIKTSVDLSGGNLTKLPDLSGTTVLGNFDCSDNMLTTLRGAPKCVHGHFICAGNRIQHLYHAPETVLGDFRCYYNRLSSLVGSPYAISGNFVCSGNNLRSLRGAPTTVHGGFDCSENRLKNLIGGPTTVHGYYDCSNNPLQSLHGAPTTLGSDFMCSFTPLNEHSTAPEHVLNYESIFSPDRKLLTQMVENNRKHTR